MILIKKIASILTIALISTTAFSCNEQEEVQNSSIVDDSYIQTSSESNDLEYGETSINSDELLDAKYVFDHLKANIENIGVYVEYNEETDENELLGRPNQYTSKINFAITTIEQDDPNDPVGGSIEVFENNDDALARASYIEELGKEYPLLVEYDFVNDYILLRIDKSVVPTEAEKYNEALQEVFNK